MIALAVLLLALLFAMTWRAKERVEDANETIREDLGDSYNEDARGHGWRDGCIIVLLTLVGTALALPLLGALVPLP